ncbi:hypothetical protein PUMCH_001202 [Australozyma saopauloensis]|uniref:Calcium-channel protein CCH1 n=1 Tax=Australozyma saopauloensis TaxID=291208 RepID=A0AAX4H7J7_9ASCO|nr:hypothetical protein PUMCH_001202 [[Candida] saopauloensis]
MDTLADDKDTKERDVLRVSTEENRTHFDRHLQQSPGRRHSLLTEAFISNSEELREEVASVIRTDNGPHTWMAETETVEAEEEQEISEFVPLETAHSLRSGRNGPLDVNALEAGYSELYHERSPTVAADRQTKISQFVMGVSLRIAGSSAPVAERRASHARINPARSSVDGQLSIGPSLTGARSFQTVPSASGANVSNIHIKPNHEQDTTARIITQPVDIASLMDPPRGPEYENYLYGNSLMMFSPKSKFRRFCYRIVSSPLMSPAVLFLIITQTAFLAYRQWNPTHENGYMQNGHTWADYVIYGINCVYTLEILAKIVSFGLLDDRIMFETLGLEYPKSKFSYAVSYMWSIVRTNLYVWKTRRAEKQRQLQATPLESSSDSGGSPLILQKYLKFEQIELEDLPGTLNNTHNDVCKNPKGARPLSVGSDFADVRSSVPMEEMWELERKLALMNVNRAYLRNNGQRLDFTSVVCFWISLPLSLTAWDRTKGFMLFRSLSTIRILRLCNLTRGTNIILRMFQAALPQLTDVGIFISCFWVIFGIIGVQSFLSSFSRHCVWTNPQNEEETYINSLLFCGSSMDSDGVLKPYTTREGKFGEIKGYTCPINSECVSGQNPYNGTVSFDNILQSMQLVFVIMSTNTFADLMYQTMSSDGLYAALFFVFGILILTVWLMNLFIAIIVTSFHTAHEESKSRSKSSSQFSKFSKYWPINSELQGTQTRQLAEKLPFLKLYYQLEIIFILLILADLIVQCFRSSGMSDQRRHALYRIEAAFTCVFLAEIVLRFALHMPYWRRFFLSKKNLFDLFLAVITSIIILNPVKERLGQAYYWLTVFQVMRFYRVAYSFRWTGDLLRKVLRNIKAIFDLGLFYFILLGLAGIIAGTYFEGTIPESATDDNPYTMRTLPNTLMSLYVITSTANWANIMYGLQSYAPNVAQRSFGSMMLIFWFIVSNFVILNIFIAIIEHALSESHEGQRKHQLKIFIKDMTKKLLTFQSKPGYLRQLKLKIFKNNANTSVDTAVTHLLLTGEAVNEFVEKDELTHKQSVQIEEKQRSDYYVLSLWERICDLVKKPFNNPFYYHEIKIPDAETFNPSEFASKIILERKHLIQRQDEYLKQNPSFNKVFYLLKPRHPIRHVCQKIVPLSHGERIDGTEPNIIVNDIFSVIMFLSSVCIVATACYLTPLTRQGIVSKKGIWNWGAYVDFAYLVIFGLEFLIKITADGLFYTPNAYVRSPWNWLDFTALASIFIEFIAFMIEDPQLSRVIRGLKALRALRLLTISETAKNNFQYTMISGFGKILSAAMVAIALLFPFSIWGLNVFNGRLGVCNNSLESMVGCINEYESEVYEWSITSPQVYSNPFLYMNSFQKSFSTFYQITSLEGWPELLQSVMKSTGVGTPAVEFARPFNGFLIILFNFVSVVFILTLFVSVIIHNYSKLTGRAYLTEVQIQWYHVKRYYSKLRASLRRDKTKMNKLTRFCYRMTVEKNRIWNSFINVVLIIHTINLLLEAFPPIVSIDNRYILFICTTACFSLDSLMYLLGLGFKLYFKNRWHIVALLITWGGFITTFVMFNPGMSFDSIYWNFNKLFLIGALMFLLPKSDRLHQLLKFGLASFPSLLSMMFTWLIVFLVYAIAMNQIFGLTKLGSNTSENINFRTIPKALILLFRMSFGENWNAVMQDFIVEEPFCTTSSTLGVSDCGNKQYAYILFMSWNVISMYIMLNLYISLILDTFSYIAGGTEYAHLIKRSELRKFKKAWQVYDPWGSGFVAPEDLRPLLSSVRGALSVKEFITQEEQSVPDLCSQWISRNNENDPYNVKVNLKAMNEYLAQETKPSWRMKLRAQDEFIEEAILTMELQGNNGIKFNDLLIQIALHSSFQTDQCLILSDFLEQKLFQRRLQDRLRKQRAYDLTKSYTCRWKYQQYRNGKILREEFLSTVT